MKNLSTAQRLMAHLNSKGKDYYANVIAETNRVLAEDQNSNQQVAATDEKSLVRA